MNTTHSLPYGTWPSPITAASLVAGARGISGLQFDRGWLYWTEARPDEAGRVTIMRWRDGTDPEQVLPAPFNARTRVHEYGGSSYLVHEGVIWFSHFPDQRLYRFRVGETPRPVTPAVELRFAACQPDPARRRLICVREDHRGTGEARNTLVALPMAGEETEGLVLFDAADFVSAPSLSRDGTRIAFVSWNHPHMPWDETSLWSAGFDAAGGLQDLTRHNPDGGESVLDPQWAADGTLYAITDRDNWWSIHRVDGTAFTRIGHGERAVEIGGPMWVLGSHHYRLIDDGGIVAVITDRGIDSLIEIDPSGTSTRLPIPSVGIDSLLDTGEGLAMVCSYADKPAELIRFDRRRREIRTVRRSREASIDPAWVPPFRLVSFPTGSGELAAHGIYLPPHNPHVTAPADRPPPLIVMVHGGPTAVATPALKLNQLYWTSRGFAILDLNYRGSTGFGRRYRRALDGLWGVADVEDAVAGARWLAAQGLADPERLIIRGGSAGGYTTLAAHAFHHVFAAGTSLYGVSDLEVLARETHKFESRYLDRIIGPYPKQRELYRQRSPLHHLEGFTAPLLLLQGVEDRIVLPNQSEMVHEALRAKGIPTAYIAFEGEGHGFRKAENIIRALEAELYFYARILGFEPADELPPIAIDNLPD